jgi:hypothetical protein
MPNEADCLEMTKRIEDSLTVLHTSRLFYREFINIINANPRLKELERNHFLTWVADNYLYSAAMSLRRILDKTQGVISIHKLFYALEINKHLLLKTSYITRFTADGTSIDLARIFFAKLSEYGHKDGLNLQILKAQIKSFSSNWERLDNYVNERIAHEAKNPSEELPTVSDLDICIDKTTEVMRLIIAYLSFASILSFEPTFQDDWKEIFSFPWMEKK